MYMGMPPKSATDTTVDQVTAHSLTLSNELGGTLQQSMQFFDCRPVPGSPRSGQAFEKRDGYLALEYAVRAPHVCSVRADMNLVGTPLGLGERFEFGKSLGIIGNGHEEARWIGCSGR